MLIYTLAAAMTLAMLIATAVAIHEEAQRAKADIRIGRGRPFTRR